MPKYHIKETCNYCGEINEYKVITYDCGIVSECETVCTICHMKDYWAYGFFESSEHIISKCKTTK